MHHPLLQSPAPLREVPCWQWLFASLWEMKLPVASYEPLCIFSLSFNCRFEGFCEECLPLEPMGEFITRGSSQVILSYHGLASCSPNEVNFHHCVVTGDTEDGWRNKEIVSGGVFGCTPVKWNIPSFTQIITFLKANLSFERNQEMPRAGISCNKTRVLLTCCSAKYLCALRNL